VLGIPKLLDAAAVGSRAYRPQLWWTNLVLPEMLHATIHCVQWLDVCVRDILDLHRSPQQVYHDNLAPLAVVNRKGEPGKTLPTLVSFSKSYAFKDNGLGLVWDATTEAMVEPIADEREQAMGFQTGTTPST